MQCDASVDDPFNVFNLPDLAPAAAERLHAHVAHLADELSVEWRREEVEFMDAEGDIGDGWFVSPPIRHEFDYFVGLHEAGHHALGLPTYPALLRAALAAEPTERKARPSDGYDIEHLTIGL
jgi:hypothetical protein